MDKRFWAVIGVIIAVFVGFMLFNGKSDDANVSSAKASSNTRGVKDSKVQLIEYGDFQCPYCAQYFPLVEQTLQRYQGVIGFRFVNLPITQLHPNAYLAARAGEAAARQGKFWEMYQQLYQNQSSWENSSAPNATFESYASSIGLDVAKFRKVSASTDVNNTIRADRQEFNKTKLRVSTPTFILNGKQIEPRSVDDFAKAIDAQLKKYKIAVPPKAADTTTQTPAAQ